jgi:hypothetical protein
MLFKAEKSNADIVICDFYEESGEVSTKIIQKPSSLYAKSVIYDLLSGFLFGACWNKLVCVKGIISKKDFCFPKLMLGEDLCANLSLLLKNPRIAYLPEAYYHYIKYNNSISSYGNRRWGVNAFMLHFELKKMFFNDYDYWTFYVHKRMPWIAYFVLYYNGASSSEFKKQFSELRQFHILKSCNKILIIGLYHYRFACFLLNSHLFIRKLFDFFRFALI